MHTLISLNSPVFMFVLFLAQDNSEVVSMRLRQEMESLRAALSRCETTLSQVAGAAQVETLGLVVEEQRQRIDSIITGENSSICKKFVNVTTHVFQYHLH